MSVVLNYLGIYLENHHTKILTALFLGGVIQIIVLFMKPREKRKINLSELLLILDCALIVVQTLLGRSQRVRVSYEIQPFYSYIQVIAEKDLEMAFQIMMNVVMFVPFGFLLPHRFQRFRKGRRVLGVSFAMSLVIELIQGFGRLGLFEIDDIINNVIGAAIGFLFYTMMDYLNVKGRIKC